MVMMNRAYDKTPVKTSNGLKIRYWKGLIYSLSVMPSKEGEGVTSACYITATIPTILCHYFQMDSFLFV